MDYEYENPFEAERKRKKEEYQKEIKALTRELKARELVCGSGTFFFAAAEIFHHRIRILPWLTSFFCKILTCSKFQLKFSIFSGEKKST